MNQLSTAVINEGNYEKELRAMLDFDEDFNGNNGLEYVDEKALAEGYESNNDWFFANAQKKYSNYIEIVQDVLFQFDNHGWNGCYDMEWNYLDVEGKTVLSLMVVNTEMN